MAFVVKQAPAKHRSTDGTQPIIAQTIKVERATAALPATTTAAIFSVLGGRVRVKALIGEVTTAIQAQANNLSVNVDSDAGAADPVATALDTNAAAVGTYFSVEGDGSALLGQGIGWAQAAVDYGFIVGAGSITLTTSATNTGSVKWTLYYEPLDETAYVVAV